jgi:pilus assembly protein CpaD
MTTRIPLHRVKAVHVLGALLGLSAALGACTPQTTEIVTASVSDDYRHRHPIAVTEANHSIVVFVGHARGGLSGSQRTDVLLSPMSRSIRLTRARPRRRSGKSSRC